MDEKQAPSEEAVNKDLKAYKALKSVQKSDELNAFMELLIKTAAQKMVLTFTSNAINDWDAFCKARGEVTAYLYPIQEVYGADAMVKHLQEYLDNNYRKPIE